jgi:hypothetical protein
MSVARTRPNPFPTQRRQARPAWPHQDCPALPRDSVAQIPHDVHAYQFPDNAGAIP